MTRMRQRKVFSDDRLTVTAVETLEFRTDRMNHRRLVTGSLTPVAVIVTEPDRTYALDMNGQPVDIDQMGLTTDLEFE
jgi:hypothetical protein